MRPKARGSDENGWSGDHGASGERTCAVAGVAHVDESAAAGDGDGGCNPRDHGAGPVLAGSPMSDRMARGGEEKGELCSREATHPHDEVNSAVAASFRDLAPAAAGLRKTLL